MDVVTSPAVRQLDNGYQAANPLDYTRMGLAEAAPIQQAVEAGNAAKNQFLLNQINNQKAMELARWQHQSQMQLAQANHEMQKERSIIRYNQVMDAKRLEMASKETMQKQDATNKEIFLKQNFLTKSLGAAPISRQEGESDAAYEARLDKAAVDKYTANKEADARKITSLTVNRQLAQRQYEQAAQDPGTQALQLTADNYGKQNAMKLADDAFSKKYGGSLAEIAKQDPSNAQQYAQEYGANLTYFKNQQTAEYLKALGSQGNPVAARLAQYKDQMASIDQQLKQVGTMPGENGRTVPSVWASDAWNRAQEVLSGQGKDADGVPTIDRWVGPEYRQTFLGTGNPVTAPTVQPQSQQTVVAPSIARPNPNQYPAGAVGPQAPVMPPGAPSGSAAVSGGAVGAAAPNNNPVTFDNNGLVGVLSHPASWLPPGFLASRFGGGMGVPGGSGAPVDQGPNWGVAVSNLVNQPIIPAGPTVIPPVDMTHRIMLLGSPGNDLNADQALAQQIYAKAGMDPARADINSARQMYLANPNAFASMQPAAQVLQPPLGGVALRDVGTAANGWMFGNGGAAAPLPPRAAMPNPVIPPNPTQFSGRFVGPQPPVMAQPPQMLSVPPGASISPLSYMPVSQPTPAEAYGNPYGDAVSTLQQADNMSYLYDR